MNRVLDFKRLFFVLRKDFFTYWRPTLIVSSAVAAILVVGGFFSSLTRLSADLDYESFFGATVVIWGCIAASMAFSELHNKSLNEDFLMLPASPFEKVLSRLLFVSLALPLIILAVVVVGSLLGESLTALVFRKPFAAFNPFQGEIWRMMGILVIVQSVFFMGAAWFKKVHLVKTVLSILVLSIIYSIIASIVFRLLFASVFTDFSQPPNFGFDVQNYVHFRYPNLIRGLQTIGKVAFYGLLAPFSWFVAYLRVEETQSSDGV